MNFCKNALLYLPRILGGFPGGSVVKNPHAKAGDTRDLGSIPGSGKSLGGGNGDPLQYPWLGNSMDRGAWPNSSWGLKRVRHILAATQQQPQNFRTKVFFFFFLIFSFLKAITTLLNNTSLKLEISNNVELIKVFILSLLCKSSKDLCHLRTYK